MDAADGDNPIILLQTRHPLRFFRLATAFGHDENEVEQQKQPDNRRERIAQDLADRAGRLRIIRPKS